MTLVVRRAARPGSAEVTRSSLPVFLSPQGGASAGVDLAIGWLL